MRKRLNVLLALVTGKATIQIGSFQSSKIHRQR